RRRGKRLAEQFGHRRAVVVAVADLGPGVVEVYPHATHAGGRQQEAGEDVVVVQRLGHGNNGGGRGEPVEWGRKGDGASTQAGAPAPLAALVVEAAAAGRGRHGAAGAGAAV